MKERMRVWTGRVTVRHVLIAILVFGAVSTGSELAVLSRRRDGEESALFVVGLLVVLLGWRSSPIDSRCSSGHGLHSGSWIRLRWGMRYCTTGASGGGSIFVMVVFVGSIGMLTFNVFVEEERKVRFSVLT